MGYKPARLRSGHTWLVAGTCFFSLILLLCLVILGSQARLGTSQQKVLLLKEASRLISDMRLAESRIAAAAAGLRLGHNSDSAEKTIISDSIVLTQGALVLENKAQGVIPKAPLTAVIAEVRNYVSSLRNHFLITVRSNLPEARIHQAYTEQTALSTELQTGLSELASAFRGRLDSVLSQQSVLTSRITLILLIASLGAISAGIGMAAYIAARIFRQSRRTTLIMENPLTSHYDTVDVTGISQPQEIADIGKRMKEYQWLLGESLTLRTVLEGMNTPLMLCDQNFVITYANKAAIFLFQSMEAWLPAPVGALVGAPITRYYKHPEQLERLCRRIHNAETMLPLNLKVRVGHEWLSVSCNALPQGETSGGFFLTFLPITETVEHQQFINHMLACLSEVKQSLQRHYYTKRLQAEQFTGTYRQVAEGINSVIDQFVPYAHNENVLPGIKKSFSV